MPSVQITGLTPTSLNFISCFTNYGLVVGVLPEHKFSNDVKQSLPFKLCFLFVHPTAKTSFISWIVDHLCK